MPGTLVDILKAIKKSDNLSREELVLQFKPIIEEYRKKYKILDDAIAGKFHFSDVADKVRKHYGHYKPLFPMSRNRDFDKYIEDNSIYKVIPTEKIMHDNRIFPEKKHVGRISNYLIDFFYNPVGLMAFYTAVAFIFKPISQESVQGQVQAFALSAGVVGIMPAIRQTYRIEKLHRDSVFLDKVIRQVYAQNP